MANPVDSVGAHIIFNPFFNSDYRSIPYKMLNSLFTFPYQTLHCRSYHQEIDGDKQNVPGKHHEDTPVKVCIHPRLNDPRGSSVGIASVYVLISWMVVLLIKPDSRVKDYQSLIHNRLA